MSSRRWIVAAIALFLSSSGPGWSQSTVTFSSKIGSDYRPWDGWTPTGEKGYQVLGNYGFELKYAIDKAFEFSGGVTSGYLYTQATQCIDATGALCNNGRQRFFADKSLDVMNFLRFESRIFEFFRPYVWTGYNYSPNVTLSQKEVFAFSADGDRDMRTTFGAGDFFEVKAGSLLRFNKDLVVDIYWKRNFGTDYRPYDYIDEKRTNDGANSFGLQLKSKIDRVSVELKYEYAVFEERTRLLFEPDQNQFRFERWVPGDFHVINGKLEYDIDKNWYWFAAGSVSWQQRNRRATDQAVNFADLDTGPLVSESRNSHGLRWSVLSGIGYFAAPWTIELQGIYVEDRSNDYSPDSSFFVPGRVRYGPEVLIEYRLSKNFSFETRFAYLWADGYHTNNDIQCPVLCFGSADIFTVYVTGRAKF